MGVLIFKIFIHFSFQITPQQKKSTIIAKIRSAIFLLLQHIFTYISLYLKSIFVKLLLQ